MKVRREIDIHRLFTRVFSTDEGKEVLEILRVQCFMAPSPRVPALDGGSTQVEFRYGRMTLFQFIEYYLQERNEQEQIPERKGVFS
jgi:hypothetical protein